MQTQIGYRRHAAAATGVCGIVRSKHASADIAGRRHRPASDIDMDRSRRRRTSAREAVRWCRLQNETLAEAAGAMSDRFEAMGTLPMQHPDLAVAELDYIVRDLGMRAVEIGTNINGRDLDGEEFRGVWKRLAELDVFVLLHPPRHPVGMERVGDYFLNNLIAYPADTTIAAARLLFSGVLRQYPTLKCCLAHGGGFLPYQIGRFDRGFCRAPGLPEQDLASRLRTICARSITTR